MSNVPAMRAERDLFRVSFLLLFLELAAIRWFPAQVLFLSFFTNTVLLACFLGMSVGCLAASSPRTYVVWTPILLACALGAARWIELWRVESGALIDVGNVRSPQLVFFGTEFQSGDPTRFVLPIEVVAGVMFALIALAMIGPGQELGRALARVPNRLHAYTVNIAGSLAGVLVFTAFAWWQIGPIWWFAIVAAGLIFLVMPETPMRALLIAIGPAAVIFFAAGGSPNVTTWRASDADETWSPYYRIDYNAADRFISVNLMGHQQMISRQAAAPAYALPHLLNRDAGRPPFSQVLIIGAGSGNDVSRALAWRADRVDAVEIDPVIYRLGRLHHPDQPYSDPRVIAHLDDGRNFLRSTTRQYDLIVYALVDSLVLHSSHSNIRLESYLFTTDALAAVHKRLKPGGVFVMYNYFRQGWIVSRLEAMLEAEFGTQNPVVFHLPSRDEVRPDDVLLGEFTMLMAGATRSIKQAFAEHAIYQVPADRPLDGLTPNGFFGERHPDWLQIHPTRVVVPAPPPHFATDAWPFLYLQRPMIPMLNLRGMAIMGGIALVFLLPFVGGRGAQRTASLAEPRAGLLLQMLFLGAGFMLVETRAIVQMALLFGGTWIVNSVVVCAVLIMILAANLFVLRTRTQSLTPVYAGLLLSLLANAVVPINLFLGWPHGLQIAASCLLVFTPILFAGVIFAVAFQGATDPGRAFGMNIAGAMLGGLTEYSSMLLGFQYLALVAVVFYLLSWASLRGVPRLKPHAPSPTPG